MDAIGGQLVTALAHIVSSTDMVAGNLWEPGRLRRVTSQAFIAFVRRVKNGSGRR
jgi:hypothetical protein